MRPSKPCSVGLRLALWLLLVFCLYPAARAHDTITTKLTWNREISRIVYSRCIGCHRPGGQAFSLLTYAEARPWAKAISEEVLERRMPPWGAVKGFGDFRNDQSLSLQQLDWIAHWVDGGAPGRRSGKTCPCTQDPPTSRPLRPGKRSRRKTVSSSITRSYSKVSSPTRSRQEYRPRLLPSFLDGAIVPRVWLYNYQPRFCHPFLLRTPLALPHGAVVRGIPPELRIDFMDRRVTHVSAK